jgi:glycerol-3-phosphate O-acyltransferase
MAQVFLRACGSGAIEASPPGPMPRSNLLLAGVQRAADGWFRDIAIDDAWTDAVRALAGRGAIIYVLRNVSVLDYLALEHLTARFDLPRIGFVNELPAAISPQPRGVTPEEQLCRIVSTGGSAVLFVKRAPARAELWQAAARRGRGGEGARLLAALLSLQRREPGTELWMMPQTFVWTQRPERRGFSIVDAVFGPADFPGELRMAAQFLLNHDNARLRAGEPLSLRRFLAEHGSHATDALVHQLTYMLLRKVERERRIIVGPAQKPPDRIIEEVLRSPKLQAVITDLAGTGEARAPLIGKARDMLRELQTIPDPQLLGSLALVAEKTLDRIYSGIDVDQEGIERLRRLRGEGSVVLLPSHKSHIDYIVLSYVLRKNAIQTPVIAAGDNLSFFPAGPLLRRCGAFFIRRSFRGDRLYTAVVDAYVRRLMRDGWILEFFVEGGRSRTGKLLPPMLGLLNMVVSAALGMEGRPVYFIPVSIAYERLMEERAFMRELSGGEKAPEDAAQLLKLGDLLVDRWGRISVQLGQEIALADLLRDLGGPRSAAVRALTPARRRALVKRLAHQAMSEINRVTAVTPGALVALALLGQGRGVAYRELLEQCRRVMALLLELGARASPTVVHPTGRAFRERGVREALRLYVDSGAVTQHVPGDTLTADARRRAALYSGTDVILTVEPHKRLLLDFAKNQIIHWLVDRALVSVAFLSHPEPVRVPELRARVLSLSRLFKYEFMFRADAPFDAIFDDVVGSMVAWGELARAGDVISAGAGRFDLDGLGWLRLHASTVRNFLEAYRVAARALTLLSKGPQARKELVKRALRIGERMFLEGEIEKSEAVSRPTIDNAVSSFIDQGYLRRDGDKVALAESFHFPTTLASIEGHIAAWLARGA